MQSECTRDIRPKRSIASDRIRELKCGHQPVKHLPTNPPVYNGHQTIEIDPTKLLGLISGIFSVALVSYITDRLRNTAGDGTLRWGWGMAFMGVLSLAFVGIIIGVLIYRELWSSQPDLIPAAIVVCLFGALGIACLLEYFLVNGVYDLDGIRIHTPWTGTKEEKWRDLSDVSYNSSMGWHVLGFKSGNQIRISRLLTGQQDIVDIISAIGYEID